MVIRSFKLKNIKEYEETNHISLLDFIYNISITGTIVFISLGNGCCSDEEATSILEESLNSEYSLTDIYKEIRIQLFGEKSVDEKAKDEEVMDISEFKTLTELYSSFYFNIFKGTNRVSYIEFWEMSTSDIYRLFEIINIQRINELNERLYELYIAAGLNSAGVWGKLPKNPPAVKPPKSKNESKKHKEQRLKMEVARLKAMGQAHNQKIVHMRGG